MSKSHCPYCGHDGAPMPVHGHGQCERCGTNIEPCCSGADAAGEAAATTDIDASPTPGLLPELFTHLGGAPATVTGDALRFALAQRLGSDLDEARLLIEAAVHVGQLERCGGDRFRLRTAK